MSHYVLSTHRCIVIHLGIYVLVCNTGASIIRIMIKCWKATELRYKLPSQYDGITSLKIVRLKSHHNALKNI